MKPAPSAIRLVRVDASHLRFSFWIIVATGLGRQVSADAL